MMASTAITNVAENNLADISAGGKPEFEIARWEQFEVYQWDGEKWRLLGAFPDLDVAKAMARTRSTRMRLVRTVYDECNQIEQDVIADLAAVQEKRS